ncbi:uncharacterized protein LOC111448497 isoform X2 [Cucurbita moschata]|uniref:Uncharacterized protein LOC111448497 isoform X2 n=1 Tax=Cucurbita moschata TaxID=3662 RepID=A0A6J1FYD2_CUCMO|nr:uncharacterized protein LOC111448497 isoform X2 [Cucurbita moschata]
MLLEESLRSYADINHWVISILDRIGRRTKRRILTMKTSSNRNCPMLLKMTGTAKLMMLMKTLHILICAEASVHFRKSKKAPKYQNDAAQNILHYTIQNL